MMGPIIKGYATSQQIIIYFWSLEANSYTGSHFMYRIISAQEEQETRLWSKGLVCLSLKFCFGSEVILCLLRHFLIRLCTKLSYGFQIPSMMSNSTLTAVKNQEGPPRLLGGRYGDTEEIDRYVAARNFKFCTHFPVCPQKPTLIWE